MAKAKEDRNAYTIKNNKMGQVQIADEVVSIIAGLAATEVEGVSSMSGNITNDLLRKLGGQKLSKGVRIQYADNEVNAYLALNMSFGYSIPRVCEKVQERVKSAIENMTGLRVADVNIKIAGVEADKSARA